MAFSLARGNEIPSEKRRISQAGGYLSFWHSATPSDRTDSKVHKQQQTEQALPTKAQEPFPRIRMLPDPLCKKSRSTLQVLCTEVHSPCYKALRPQSMSREGQWSCEGSGAEVWWGAAEGTGVAQSGEEEAQGRPYCSLQ